MRQGEWVGFGDLVLCLLGADHAPAHRKDPQAYREQGRTVHSRYLRTLRDLPTSGRPVRLVLEVRRFVCGERTGVRKIFADLQW